MGVRPRPPAMSADMKAERYVCRLCDKDLSRSSYEQRVAHVKKCSKSMLVMDVFRNLTRACSMVVIGKNITLTQRSLCCQTHRRKGESDIRLANKK